MPTPAPISKCIHTHAHLTCPAIASKGMHDSNLDQEDSYPIHLGSGGLWLKDKHAIQYPNAHLIVENKGSSTDKSFNLSKDLNYLVLAYFDEENLKEIASTLGYTGNAPRRSYVINQNRKVTKDPTSYNVNIRGIKSADTATDIKKAYHKATLRHHADKLLARSEVGDEGQLWKEISQEVYKDADKLFKMIGEAYTALSDPAQAQAQKDEERGARQTEEGMVAEEKSCC
ncbi:hypothetical protein JHK84_048313 [Glycine max]|nr:hypothetical protein JHK85_048913 [Glycine max]KAG5103344.1 hypothetical protein JHK84_048313 [Glycine max]